MVDKDGHSLNASSQRVRIRSPKAAALLPCERHESISVGVVTP